MHELFKALAVFTAALLVTAALVVLAIVLGERGEKRDDA
jgi:hypothetical protein